MDASLVLPVVLWDAPPAHVITSLLMTGDKRYLITGSRSGMIGVWTIASKDAPEDEVRLKPHMMLAGCDSPITALALTSRPPTDGFASLTLDGTLSVWDHKAGTCVASARRLLGNIRCPTRMVSLPDCRHVAISGQTTEIKIVDLWTMQVVKRIQQHKEWICALHSCDLGGVEHHPFLLSLDASGVLGFHSMLYLNDYDGPPVRTMCIDEHDIDTGEIRVPSGPCVSVCVSPAAKTLIVVKERAWLLYTASNPQILCKVDSPEGTSWRGATYINALQVLVWAKNGVAYHYDLPKEVNGLEPLTLPGSMIQEPPWMSSPNYASGEPVIHSPIPRVPSLPSLRELGSTLAGSANRFTTRMSHLRDEGIYHSHSSPSSRLASPVSGDIPAPRISEAAAEVDALRSRHVQSGEEDLEPGDLVATVATPGTPSVDRREGTPGWKIVSVTSDLEAEVGDESIVTTHSIKTSGVVQTEDADEPTREDAKRVLSNDIRKSAPRLRSSLVFPNSDSADTSRRPASVGANRITTGAWNEVLAMGDATGAVAVWRVSEGIVKPQHFILTSLSVDSSQDLFVDESGEIRLESSLPPWAVAKLSDGWRGISDSSSAVVSASLIVEDTLLLARGYDNGDISISGLPSQDDPPRFIRRAHSSRVTSLISYEAGSTHLLISAGADSVIKVWNIVTAELEHVFSHHAGPVTHLIRPETREWLRPSVAGDVFISVSKDKSVGLFSLDNMKCIHMFGGHPTQICDVGWRAEQDYIIVQCEDGSVSVWEISSGMLESRIYGNSAEGIMENTPRLLRRGYGASALEDEQAVTSFTVCLEEHDSPLQVLNLNVKKLVQDLYTTMKLPRATDQSHQNTGGEAAEASSESRAHRPRQSVPVSGRASSSEPVKRRSLYAPKVKPQGNGGLASSRENLKSSNGSNGHAAAGRDRSNSRSKSKALLASNSYLLFSYLIPWNTTELLDPLCTHDLILHPPSPHVTFALKSGDRMLGILVPTSAQHSGRWQSSDTLTALHALAAVTFTKSLLYLGNKNASSQLLTYFCSMAPEITPDYIEPSLLFLTSYYQDPMDDVMQSTRALFSATVSRMSSDALNSFARSQAELLDRRPEERENRILMLAILGSERPDCLEPAITQEVVRTLFDILKRKDSPLQLTAAELLGKGFASWRSSFKDTKALVQSLYLLTLLGESSSISGMAHNSLLLIGSMETRAFIDSLSEMISRAGTSTRDRTEALMLIAHLVTKKGQYVVGEVGKITEAVVNSLDPNVPELRESCIGPAKVVLQAIVKHFPMVSFQQTSQRLAVGTPKAVILIYDLKTATRWHVLDKGHTGPITAVAYNAEGDKLASYSMADGRIVLWATKASFFEYFAAAPSPQRVIETGPADRPVPPVVALEARLQWTGPKQLQLLRKGHGSATFKL